MTANDDQEPLGGRPSGGDRAVISRTFALLDAFRHDPVLGVRQLARATGLAPSTTQRLAGQLVEVGVLSRVGRQYRLGAKLFELGTLHYPAEIRNALHPFLVDLQRLTGGDVSTVELIDRHVVVVEYVPARRSNPTERGSRRKQPVESVGARIPAHAAAGGKAILASLPRLPYKTDEPLEPVTPKTTTSLPVLRKELAGVRSGGLAYDYGGMQPGRSGVAAPLLNRHGRVLGALMVTGPEKAFDGKAVGVAVAAIARTLTRVGQTTNITFYANARPTGTD